MKRLTEKEKKSAKAYIALMNIFEAHLALPEDLAENKAMFEALLLDE